MSDVKKSKIKLLCLGQVILKGDRKGIEFVDANDLEFGKRWCFKSTAMKLCFPGHYYEFCIEEGSLYGSGDFVSVVKDKQYLTQLRAQSSAAETYFTSLAHRKKAGASKDYLDCLLPIRKAYKSTNGAGRAAVLARAIQFIQTGEK